MEFTAINGTVEGKKRRAIVKIFFCTSQGDRTSCYLERLSCKVQNQSKF